MDAYTLSSEIVDTMARIRPVAATYQGLPGHDDEWDDFSLKGADHSVSVLREFQHRARELPVATERWARLAQRVMEEFLRQELDWYAYGDHLIDLNNITSSFQTIREVFDVMDTSSREGWQNVVSRLETIDGALDGYRATLEAGRRGGRVVAKRQALAAIRQGRVHAGDASFFRRLPDAMKQAGITDSALEARLATVAPRACAAFGRMADYLESTYLPSAVESDAVGAERYARQTRRFLGMDIDPVETYAWGWSEVRTLGEQIRRIADRIAPGKSLHEVVEVLKTDPARSASSPESFAAMMLERQEKALSDLDGVHFDIPDPIRKVAVRLAPPGGALTAYYVQPSEDFSRPGTVWYSLGDKKVIPLYDEISTAYHEGFPGHHLQCGIQVALADRLSRLHRLSVWYPGYGEGWALYAEHLMNELGYFERPEYVLGMLTNQMLRACRVVIDIGNHLELTIPKDQEFHPGAKWSFELGVEMLTSRAFTAREVAESEVTRYLGWPGQAISYKVGQRVILDLREELRRQRGPKFSLKEFHARVVGSGPVGLALLKELVLSEPS